MHVPDYLVDAMLLVWGVDGSRLWNSWLGFAEHVGIVGVERLWGRDVL